VIDEVKSKMVYCVKCGTKNPDDAETCVKCGAQLYTTGRSEYHERLEHECFGIPRGGTIVGLAIGFIVLFWGLIWLAQQAGWISENVSVWPLAIIIFGVLMIMGALYGLRRRY
jgi:ribosomal protein L40E